MPLDFPNSPNVNDTFTSGTRTWKWNGTSWDLVPIGHTHAMADLVNFNVGTPATGQALVYNGTKWANATIPTAADLALKAPLVGPDFSKGGITLVRVADSASMGYGGEVNTLQVRQDVPGADAFMSFHVAADYAAHFGIDGSTNDLAYGGWSAGGTKNRVFHQGNIRLAAQPIGDISSNWTTDVNWVGGVIRSVGGAVTVYVSNVMSVGQRMDFLQYGSGQITFAASGVNLNAAGGKLKTSGQWSMASILCHAPNYYVLVGDIAA